MKLSGLKPGLSIHLLAKSLRSLATVGLRLPSASLGFAERRAPRGERREASGGRRRINHLLVLAISIFLIFGYVPTFAQEEQSIIKESLDNGFIVLIKPTQAENILSINVIIRAGLSSENEYAGTGITHFIEHMIFKGTKKRGPGQIESEIKSYGGYVNASTGLDTTSFYLTISSSYFKEALELLSDAVLNPSFDEVELEKERSVILNEIKLRNDDPSTYISNLLFENAYLRQAYRYPIIGYKDSFNKLKRDDLAAYHKKLYAPNNMVLALIGDINPSDALNAVKETFGKYEREMIYIDQCQNEPDHISERISLNYMDLNLGYFAIGYHTVGLLNKDLFALDILAHVLGQGNNSRLNETLVKEKELLYSINSFNYTPFYPGLFIISGIGNPENLEAAVKEIKKEITKITRLGITKLDHKKAKANVLSGFLSNLETVQSQAADLSQNEMLTGDYDFSRKYVEGITKVQLNNIRNVSKNYLTDENCTVIYLFPKTAELKHPIESRYDSGISTKSELKNGLKVILKEERRLPLISIAFSCLGGLRAEEKQFSGISNLTSQMLLKGTRKRKESNIKGSMENIGGQIDAFSGMNSFGITMEFMKKDAIKALDLLEDVIKHPDFPDNELLKLKNKIYAAIKIEEDDIFEKGLFEFRKGLFKNHPYGNRLIGERDAIAKIKRQDIAEFYNIMLNSKNIVMSIAGDFDKDAMLKIIDKKFRDIPANDYHIKTNEISLEKSFENTFFMPKEEALFIIGFRGLDVKNPDRYALEIISSLMSGSDGRIFQSLRNKIGLSYAQGASSVAGIEPGYFFFYAATDKKEINNVEKIINDEILKIKTEYASDNELISAKNSIIGNQAISMQSNSAKAFTTSLDELYSLGYDNYKKYKENIEKCTKDDIMRAANKYFDLNKSFSVTILPEESN